MGEPTCQIAAGKSHPSTPHTLRDPPTYRGRSQQESSRPWEDRSGPRGGQHLLPCRALSHTAGASELGEKKLERGKQKQRGLETGKGSGVPPGTGRVMPASPCTLEAIQDTPCSPGASDPPQLT